MNQLLDLVVTFLKIGTFSFGGGYGMIPMIQMETVDIHHWITSSRLMDLIVISQSTPGPIAVNLATFIGFQKLGFAGSLFATLAVTVPSFTIAWTIGSLKKRYEKSLRIEDWMFGIRPVSIGLIAGAVYLIGRNSIVNPVQLILAGGVFGLCVKTRISGAYILVGSALIGIAFGLISMHGGNG